MYVGVCAACMFVPDVGTNSSHCSHFRFSLTKKGKSRCGYYAGYLPTSVPTKTYDFNHAKYLPTWLHEWENRGLEATRWPVAFLVC